MSVSNPLQRSSELAHAMSNSLAYVMANLQVLAESTSHDPALLALVQEALEGSERLGVQVRELRSMGWAVPDDPEVPANPAPATSGRVLVIDDELPILKAVSRLLDAHEVTICESAEEALKELVSGTFDVVLCDLLMPGMSGMALYQQLCVTHPLIAERFVFMTGGGFTQATRDFLRDVPNRVVHKPFGPKTLRWLVSQQVRGAHTP